MPTRGLRVELRKIRSFDQQHKCNDCDKKAVVSVSFPLFDQVFVCIKCYKKYYKEKIERNDKYRS